MAHGFSLPEVKFGPAHSIKSFFSALAHFFLRAAVSVVLAMTTAVFLELGLFEKDIQSHLSSENRAANEVVFAEATNRIDDEIARAKSEIDQLDGRAKALLDEAISGEQAGHEAVRSQIATLASERAKLLERISELSAAIDCDVIDREAEDSGGQRCDGSTVTNDGQGDKWASAQAVLSHRLDERSRAENRLEAIDEELQRLQSSAKVPLIVDGTQDKLNVLATRRAEAMKVLADLIAGRSEAIQQSAIEDLRFEDVPEGLIIRGEALDELAKSSSWMAWRIIMVTLSMILLDLAAVFVVAVAPPPVRLAIGEVLATEVAVNIAIADAETRISRAKKQSYQAREVSLSEEAEVEGRLATLRTTMATRSHMASHIDNKLRSILQEEDI